MVILCLFQTTTITIRTNIGSVLYREFDVTTKQNRTIASLKKKIFDTQTLSGVNSVQQLRLWYGAQQLQDNNTIRSYGITSGSVVQLTRKLNFTFQRIYLLQEIITWSIFIISRTNDITLYCLFIDFFPIFCKTFYFLIQKDQHKLH